MTKVLKIKSVLYRYTGIYLAYKEELEYIESKKYWKDLSRIYEKNRKEMYLRNTHGLIMGMWQCKHDFARPISFLCFKKPGVIFKPLSWLSVLFQVIKWDLRLLYKKVRK